MANLNFFSVLACMGASLSMLTAHAPGERRDHDSGWCFPANSLQVKADGARAIADGGVDQTTYNRVIDDVIAVYDPIVTAHGGTLIVNRLWEDSTVNARAYREGANWYIDMYGGLARHPATTEEGLYLVICHEMGHHLGGAPKFSDPNGAWAGVEGQADYFSALKCMRRVFAGKSNQVANEPPGVRSACEQSYSDPNDVGVCIRMTMGGISSGEISYAIAGGTGPHPSLSTPDPAIVPLTFEQHPAAQCRLDTYYAAALCQAPLNVEPSNTDPEQGGVCSLAQNSKIGDRPLCWYHPLGTNTPNPPNPPDHAPTPPEAASGIAHAPLLNGKINLIDNAPDAPVAIHYDVAAFANAAQVYIEVTEPNEGFTNQNGIVPDPRALGSATVNGVSGDYSFVPARQLVGSGRYSFRLIPLDSSGKTAVGQFSNPAVLQLGAPGGNPPPHFPGH